MHQPVKLVFPILLALNVADLTLGEHARSQTASQHSSLRVSGIPARLHSTSDAGQRSPESKELRAQVQEILRRLPKPGQKMVIGESHPVAARHVALCLFAVLISGPILFAMTQTKVPYVPLYTLFAAEQVVSVFIAVMAFQAVDDVADAILTSDYVNVDVHQHHHMIVVAHALCWLPVAAVVAFYLPTHGNSLSIFCGLGAHVLSFFWMHATITVQESEFSHGYMLCFVGFLVLAVLSVLLVIAGYFGKRAVLGDYPGSTALDEHQVEWVEKVDEIEHDFLAMAMATYHIMAIRFCILGHYSHFEGVKPGSSPLHSLWHRSLLLLYLIALIVGSVPFRAHLDQLSEGNIGYVGKRTSDFARSFLSMSIAWAFILWGHWEIHERWIHWSPMFARLVFAAICSCIMFVAVWAIALTSGDRVNRFSICTVSLIVGFTWEESINHSFDVVLEGFPRKYMWKSLVAFVVSLVIVPVWAVYLRPLTACMLSDFTASVKLSDFKAQGKLAEVNAETGKS